MHIAQAYKEKSQNRCAKKYRFLMYSCFVTMIKVEPVAFDCHSHNSKDHDAIAIVTAI
jgi:hypothetical protein